MTEITESRITEINKLHNEITAGIKTAVYKAVEMGGLLKEVKESLPHGNFSHWIELNISFDIRTAQRYMKAHNNRDRLKNDNVTYLTQLIDVEEKPSPRTAKPEEGILQDLFRRYPQIEVSDVGMKINEPITREVWNELFERASVLDPDGTGAWIIGDLLGYAETRVQKLIREKHELIRSFVKNNDLKSFLKLLENDASNVLKLIEGIGEVWPGETKEEKALKLEWLNALNAIC